MRWVLLLLGVMGCGRVDFDDGPNIPRDGLVAYYPLDELDSGRTIDEVANIAAMCHDTCPLLTAGHTGNAMHFQGERIEVPPTSAVETTTGFTVAAWVFPESFPAMRFSCAVTKTFGTTTANSWTLCTSQAGQVFFGTTDSAGTTLTQDSVRALDLMRWNHVAVSWDGTTKRIFINGVFDSAVANGTMFDGGRISIGADYDNMATTEQYEGSVDDVVVYNRALDEAEIRELAR